MLYPAMAAAFALFSVASLCPNTSDPMTPLTFNDF